LPDVAEKELMKSLVGTYGKPRHAWQIARGDKRPLGIPQLMTGFAADGQAELKMVEARDKSYGISSEEKKNRADVAATAIQPGTDAWQKAEVIQLQAPTSKARKGQ
jgi:hypothetical protein